MRVLSGVAGVASVANVVVIVALFVACPAYADTVTQFGDGPFGSVESALLVPLGLDDPSFETTATTFAVPGSSGTTNLTFTFRLDLGSFLFTFGYYPLSAVSADPVTDKVTYAMQAISAGTVIFDDRLVDPVTVSSPFPLPAGTNLGFFLIPNDTVANFLADPQSYYDPPANTDGNKRAPLFSVSNANPGELDQLLSFAGNGITLFTWEDLTRIPGGDTDNSFTDLAFTVDAELGPGSGSCGNGVVDPGETCDDGNTVQGCRTDKPQKPVDACNNDCTRPMCKDPSRIYFGAGHDRIRVHGRITPPAESATFDPAAAPFALRLSSVAGDVFAATLEPATMAGGGSNRRFIYRDPAAIADGGIAFVELRQRDPSSWAVTVVAYGDLHAATTRMTAHVLVGGEEWTAPATWTETSQGWTATH